MIVRFGISLTVFSILLVLILILNLSLLDLFGPESNSVIHEWLRFFYNNKFVLTVSAWLVGVVILFIVYWIRTLRYLDEVVKATEKIHVLDDNLIELPMELKEVENQMNQIKINVRQNERAAKEAEQRKNDLVVYLAHDLKTPLTSVIGYLTLLRDESQISDELRTKYLSISLEKAERLEDLINEFFEITRFNLSNIELDFSMVNLSRMLEQVTYEFKPLFAKKNLTCSLDMDKDIAIKCDPGKLQRVFDNLLRNAVNYSFENTDIKITAVKTPEGIVMKFINRGNTISKEKLNRIFEQFYRLDSARTTKTGGAGLGLAIAKEIVKHHGGNITANSENEMIQFEIFLPILP